MRISDWSSEVCSSDLLHQKPGRGSATIAVVNEQAPKEYGVQVLQVEMAGQRDGACQDVGMEHAPDARAFHVVMIDPPGQPGVAAAQLAQYFRLCRMQQAFDRSCPQGVVGRCIAPVDSPDL